MAENLTCGDRYKALTEMLFPPSVDGQQYHALVTSRPAGSVGYACHALGFMHGQAEKVSSGACQAFMVRPGKLWFDWALEAAKAVLPVYGLKLVYDSQLGEIWGCRDDRAALDARKLYELFEPEADDWHWMRAWLCGIALSDFDPEYHLRANHRADSNPRGHNGGPEGVSEQE